jgi:hypothetical protein
MLTARDIEVTRGYGRPGRPYHSDEKKKTKKTHVIEL